MVIALLLVSPLALTLLGASSTGFAGRVASARNGDRRMLQMSVEATRQAKPVKGYFAISDLLLVERNEEDVASFHEKERVRWLEVYDEVYVPKPQASWHTLSVHSLERRCQTRLLSTQFVLYVLQEFYIGDRVVIVSSMKVAKTSEDGVQDYMDAKGLQGARHPTPARRS